MPAVTTSTATAASSAPVVNGGLVKAEPLEGTLPALPPTQQQKRRRASTPPGQHQPVASTSYAGGDNGHGLGVDAFSEPAEGQPDALLPSFFRVEPYDEMQKRIGDWIWAISKGHQHIEVRAVAHPRRPAAQLAHDGQLVPGASTEP
jgi:hypothetical protein